ncbi:MoaD/ThiS family protein [Curtobacterium aurantiacum]|uniref:MoaD/ThiS family protein n=1 Tax=Curtobacterium aurantiacum TaxID=3236919 RepID=A0ABS5VI95_9MICO|nr:MoaD/ThiS family protein [Curtobacterium flaccumfaciens]MBT1546283.1 MoaD/ThiS family protein [Curtobacterium flaccumfaciens pv. flaccumfaciens]MBT1589216.1 MoaD/ThiS family protein [Curtobacterium flaccumfaciens pv. flaccumfaciens]MBT1680917.1 MoaD/ThiS family protein [Curtobacterium flaccumfaciens pv. flaccumfaciens]
MTTIRFFAAARAAVGVDSLTTTGRTIESALGAIDAAEVADPERWSALQERCSYLVDGVTTRDRGTALEGVEVVDVMPPFAGG